MGKPHCNSSIWTFKSCTRFNVNFAYAELHSLNGISCLTSLKRKRRNNVWIVNMYLKNLRLRFRLVKICNKKLLFASARKNRRLRIRLWFIVLPSVSNFCLFFLPCLCFCFFPCFSVFVRVSAYVSSWSYFRVSASAYFRVIPCKSVAMLMRLLGPVSVSLLLLISVKFRVNPWLCLCVFLAYFRGYADASSWSYFRVHPWQIIFSDCFYIRWILF